MDFGMPNRFFKLLHIDKIVDELEDKTYNNARDAKASYPEYFREIFRWKSISFLLNGTRI